MKFIRICCSALLLLSITHAAIAGPVIYDNGGPSGDWDGWFSDLALNQVSADDFVLAPGSNILADIHWFGSYGVFPGVPEPAEDDFTIEIFSDLTQAPEHVIDVGNQATRKSLGPRGALDEAFEYGVDISPIVLAAGTTYWLSIFNNTQDGPNGAWAWTFSVDLLGGGDAAVGNPGALSPFGGENSFFLTTVAVPTPASLTLIALAVGGMGWARRRKR